jgi:hypothetical protein
MDAIVDDIKARIQQFGPEPAEFRAWFLPWDNEVWDAQIEIDSASGKLDVLIAEARADMAACLIASCKPFGRP